MFSDNLRCRDCGKLTSKLDAESRTVYNGKCAHCEGGELESYEAKHERVAAVSAKLDEFRNLSKQGWK